MTKLGLKIAIVSLAISLTSMTSAAAAVKSGETLSGTKFVSVREFAISKGYVIKWHSKIKNVFVNTKGNKNVVAFVIGNPNAKVKGVKAKMTPASYVDRKTGLTMVPLSFISKALGVSSTVPKTVRKVSTSKIAYTSLSYSSLSSGFFPLKPSVYQSLINTYGVARSYGGARKHEGIDIMAKAGTPIYSAFSGRISKYGWNELGGWRLNIDTPDNKYSIYYAHMSRYASGIYTGVYVNRGQLIGYVGSTGYGPTGTSGKFVSHLHFGIYNKNGFTPINPFNYLKQWESNSKKDYV